MTTIKGTKGDDYLTGTDQFDLIKGGRGRDMIDGGSGGDMLYGGKGADTFLLTAPEEFTRIEDFQTGKDRIVIDIDGYDYFFYSYGSLFAGPGPDHEIVALLPSLTPVANDDIFI